MSIKNEFEFFVGFFVLFL